MANTVRRSKKGLPSRAVPARTAADPSICRTSDSTVLYDRHAALLTGSNSGCSVSFTLANDVERDFARHRDLNLIDDGFLIADQRFYSGSFSASGRKNTFSRPSIRTRASDLKRGRRHIDRDKRQRTDDRVSER